MNFTPLSPKFAEWLLVACFVAIPFGIAVHSLMLGLLVLACLFCRKSEHHSNSNYSRQPVMMISLLLLLWVIWNLIATGLNPANESENYVGFFFGFANLALIPILVRWKALNFRYVCRLINKIAPWVLGIWALVALSQNFWGWSLVREVGMAQNFRAHGFYSHPLTLAYVATLLWPYSLYRLFKNFRSPASIVIALSNLILIVFTDSRTCLAACILVFLWMVIKRLSGGKRVLALGAFAILALAIGNTENRVSHRIATTIDILQERAKEGYADNRLVFWHAHSEMVQERPWTGHGIDLNTAYRTPYYEKIGQGDFRNKYAAHNQFLQVTANGGYIGLTLFLCWIAAYFLHVNSLVQPHRMRSMLMQMMLILLLSSLTQDAFYDAEIRFVLCLILCFVYCPPLEKNFNATKVDSDTAELGGS